MGSSVIEVEDYELCPICGNYRPELQANGRCQSCNRLGRMGAEAQVKVQVDHAVVGLAEMKWRKRTEPAKHKRNQGDQSIKHLPEEAQRVRRLRWICEQRALRRLRTVHSDLYRMLLEEEFAKEGILPDYRSRRTPTTQLLDQLVELGLDLEVEAHGPDPEPR